MFFYKKYVPISLLFFTLCNAIPVLGNTPPGNSRGDKLLYFKVCRVTETLNILMDLDIFPDTTLNQNTGNYPVFPDLVYEYKIAAIGNLSPIDFDYNQHVRRYIDIYTLERREQVSQMLGLADLYFPLFDEMLDKHQLPLELKYLAVVESALNPLAVSSSGAVGMWQFLINSARMFDLEVNSYIDERMDPAKSTEAACMYLKYLYRIFNDWHLVMAAYNSGPGAVKNAIARSGGETNFWKLYEHLPEAAQNYVPAFIAAAYVMENAKEHQIYPLPPVVTYFQTDTINLSKPTSIRVISDELGIPMDVLLFLNPIYRRAFVPKSDELASIRIPEIKVDEFLAKEQLIYEKSLKKSDYHDVVANAGETNGKIMIVHKVQPGDYLHKIAIMYSCTVDDINIWNQNLGSELSIGQSITVWVDIQTYNRIKQESTSGF